MIAETVAHKSANRPFVAFPSLNFDYRDTLISGPNGNIIMLHPSFLLQKRPTDASRRFDVDEIHKLLAAKAYENNSSGKHNIVTAAFTLIIRKKDIYYAVSGMLVDKDKKPRCFLSGLKSNDEEKNNKKTVKKNDNKKVLSSLFDVVKKRMEDASFRQGIVKEICEAVQKAQHDAMKNIPSIITTYEAENKIAFLIELVQRKIKIYDGYGPFIDSEQFLLSDLESNFITKLEDESVKGYYVDLIESCMQFQYDYLRKKFIKIDKDNSDLRKAAVLDEMISRMKQELDEWKEACKSVEDFEILGCILHIFSTNEFCQFCGASIVCEFHERKDNFVQRCKAQMSKTKNKEDVFFVALASWDESLGDSKHELRPPGTNQISRPPSEEEITKIRGQKGKNEASIMCLDAIIRNQALPLKHIAPSDKSSKVLTVNNKGAIEEIDAK